MSDYILTVNGGKFYFSDPDDYDYRISEIASALANICRFTGHCNQFYSVADHSILVSRLVDEDFELAALLHDASEAYLGDVSSPLKALIGHQYKSMERAVSWAIRDCFHLDPVPSNEEKEAIREADMQALALEKKKLMPDDEDPWECLEGIVVPEGFNSSSVECGGFPEGGAPRFIQRYREITE